MARAGIAAAGLAVVLVPLLAACGAAVYPKQPATWLGSRKRTVAAAEEALRGAMGAPGIRIAATPGNEEAVMVNPGQNGGPTCVAGAWFTLDGAAKDLLGEGFQYSWHLCAGAEHGATLEVHCVEIRKTESSTNSQDCAGGIVAGAVIRRSDRLLGRLKDAAP
ncbi:MAG: hypothetical protein EXR72_12485 [Myxococcales bacterium]|nr:hypothetical protein [Myxococcales bacterium]